MIEENKKLFDERFNVFWAKLTKKEKLNDETKKHYQEHMFKHFNELIKSLNVDRSLWYVFHIPIAIINFHERGSQRNTKSYSIKYFQAVIKYYLENEVSEYYACDYIFKENKLSYSNQNTFRYTFRKWYQDNWNREDYPEIGEYLMKMRENKYLNSIAKKDNFSKH